MSGASQVDRVLALLRSQGSRGLNTASVQEIPILDGGKPILRLAARICQLREQGYSISSQRQANGTKTYHLEDEPERTLSETNDPVSWEQADPGSVPISEAPVSEGVRSAASAQTHPQESESSLFDTSLFTERGGYRDTERAA